MLIRNITVATSALLCAAAFIGCQKSAVKDPVAKIGGVTIGAESFESFKKAARVYPAVSDVYPSIFPGTRQPITFMAECEVIYQATKSSGTSNAFSNSRDWEWKKRFVTAAFFRDLLIENLGFTDAQIESYYKSNAESFRVNSKTADGENDSSYIPGLDIAKRQVVDALFYSKYKPDSAFIARVTDREGDLDSAALRNYWLYSARSNSEDFFMRLIYKEETGETYTDSIQQIYGEGKNIVPEDLEIIRSWVPENRRSSMLTKDLVEYLYKWQTFSARAEKMGLTNSQTFKDVMHWVVRIEHAITHLQNNVLPKISADTRTTGLDTSLAELMVSDTWGHPFEINELRTASELDNINKTRLSAKVDSVIYGLRKNKVTFPHEDHKDERSANPSALLAKADSLRDLASDNDPSDANAVIDEAEAAYRVLTTDFAFTPEGRKAFGEIAKLQIDKYTSNSRNEKFLLSSAINFYRKGQILESDLETICNSSFMVGFTYDEHLSNYPLAETNYKWILRNTPACALAADAEFMIQHLGEPMTSIEEIQGQSMRQGRKVDFDDDAAEGEGEENI